MHPFRQASGRDRGGRDLHRGRARRHRQPCADRGRQASQHRRSRARCRGHRHDEHGYVTVDDRLETSVPGIWALGDCNGRGAFTHTSYNDFEIVAANLLDGADRRVTDRLPCYGLYVDPPLGRVGMGEAEAKAKGHRIKVGKRAMTRVGRAVEKGEAKGFMKIVVDADSDAILGGTILGPGGDEAVHVVLDMMQAGQTATALRTHGPHPPDRVRADPHDRGRAQARLTRPTAPSRSDP